MSDRPSTPLLDTISSPKALRTLKEGQLRQVADELRAEMISAVELTFSDVMRGSVAQPARPATAKNRGCG